MKDAIGVNRSLVGIAESLFRGLLRDFENEHQNDSGPA